MELKRFFLKEGMRLVNPFNRTSMELKLATFEIGMITFFGF